MKSKIYYRNWTRNTLVSLSALTLFFLSSCSTQYASVFVEVQDSSGTTQIMDCYDAKTGVYLFKTPMQYTVKRNNRKPVSQSLIFKDHNFIIGWKLVVLEKFYLSKTDAKNGENIYSIQFKN